MIHRHHRKRRSQGGDDSPANVVEIPDWLHEKIHREPEWAYENGWLVRSHQEPTHVSIRLPEDVAKPRRSREKDPNEPPKPRASVQIKVPVDVRENGAEVLRTLLDEVRNELVENEFKGTWNEDVPIYHPLVAALADWLNGR